MKRSAWLLTLILGVSMQMASAEHLDLDEACVSDLSVDGDAILIVSGVDRDARTFTLTIADIGEAAEPAWSVERDGRGIDTPSGRRFGGLFSTVLKDASSVMLVRPPYSGSSLVIAAGEEPVECCEFERREEIPFQERMGVFGGGLPIEFGRFVASNFDTRPGSYVGVIDIIDEKAEFYKLPGEDARDPFIGPDGTPLAVAGPIYEGPQKIFLANGAAGWDTIAEVQGVAREIAVYPGDPDTDLDNRVVIVYSLDPYVHTILLYEPTAQKLESAGSVYENAAGWGIDRSTGALVWVETMAGVLSPPEPFPADRRLLRALNEMVSEGYHTFHLLDRAPNGATLIAVDGAPHDAGPARYFLLRPEAERFESACAVLQAALAREPGG